MPVKKKKSRKEIANIVQHLMKEGYSQKHATTIAFEQAGLGRQSKRDAYKSKSS